MLGKLIRELVTGGGAPMRLHIGGRERREGWKIFNIQPGENVDYVGNCTDLGRFADGSVLEIYASHVLEHLGYQRDLPRALAEFHRVLKPGGAAMISVPDFDFICRRFVDPAVTMDERVMLMRFAFGGQLDEHDFHYVGLTWEFLNDFLARAGFARVERVEGFGLFDDSSARRFGSELRSLNVVAYK
jgi:predicted SAM-dependent methyltransferase